MFEQVKEVLVDALNLDESEIELTSTLKDLGVDSLAVVELVLELESTFDVEIGDDELPNLHTVEDVVKLIESKK